MRAAGFDTAADIVTLLALDDGTGSRLRVEHDARDGRAYITVTFAGQETPFEITAEQAAPVAVAVFTATHPGFTGLCHLDGSKPVRAPKTRRRARPPTGKRGLR